MPYIANLSRYNLFLKSKTIFLNLDFDCHSFWLVQLGLLSHREDRYPNVSMVVKPISVILMPNAEVSLSLLYTYLCGALNDPIALV